LDALPRLLLVEHSTAARLRLASSADKVNHSLFQRKRLQFAVDKREGRAMNLSPPTTAVFIISAILAVLAIIGTFVALPFISPHAFWVAIIAYVILAVGNLFRGV
jgi:hypothetical protein